MTAFDDSDVFELEVGQELYRQRVRREAARRLRLAGRPRTAVPVQTLTEVLAAPPAHRDRVDGLIPWDASTLIVAQRKTGKSTFALNLAHSLLTGTPFLGALEVQPIAGAVAYLNFEVSGYTLAAWGRDLGLDDDRLLMVNLRGLGNPLDDDETAQELADELRARHVETIIVDTFTRAYTGTSENDAGEVGAWLNRLAAWTREQAGALDLIVTAHAGWGGEQGRGTRARGSSALEDWPDSIVYLTKDEDGTRYVRADGRDVDMPQDALAFDETTRRMTLTGQGSRADVSRAHAVESMVGPVYAFVLEHPESSGSEIARGISGKRVVVFDAIRQCLADGLIVETKRAGRGGGKAYSATEPVPTSSNQFPEGSEPVPTVPKGTGSEEPVRA